MPSLAPFALSLPIIKSHILFVNVKSLQLMITLWTCYSAHIIKFGWTFISLIKIDVHLILLVRLVWVLILVLRITPLFGLHLILNLVDLAVLISVLRDGPWILLHVPLLLLVLVAAVWLLNLIVSIFRWWLWHLAVEIVVDDWVHLIHGWGW